MVELIVGVAATVTGGLILHWIVTSERARRTFQRGWPRRRSIQHPARLLLYLSEGGTCRDPMAKAITLKLLEKRLPDVKNLRVEGMALAPTSKQHVSFGARRAIEDLYGEDLLGGYVPKTVTAEDLEAADLVLVMDRDLLNKRMPKGPRLPSNKTYVFKEFFGLQGDIKDPWPDGKDQETLSRYRQRADEIKTTLETDFDRLLDALGLGGQEKEQLEPGSTSARL